MIIEVTKETFESLFNSKDFTTHEVRELFEVVGYHNKNLNQGGKKVFNFVSSINWQYYLYDINA